MRTFSSLSTLALAVAVCAWAPSASAGVITTTIFSNTYDAAGLDGIFVDPDRSHTVSAGGLNVGTNSAGKNRQLMLQTSLGAVSAYDTVTFDITMDVQRNGSDQDLLIGVHDGTDYLGFWGTDGGPYGTAFGDDLDIGGGSFGIGLSNGGPNPPDTVRESMGGTSSDSYAFQIVMDATGLATLNVASLGFTSSAMQLDVLEDFSFFVGSDANTEVYRLLDASVTVTGTNIPVPAPWALLALAAPLLPPLLPRLFSRGVREEKPVQVPTTRSGNRSGQSRKHCDQVGVLH